MIPSTSRSGSSIRVDDLAEVVRRDVGCHPDRDARRAIDQQVGDSRWHDDRLGFRFVVIGNEIDRFLVKICKNLVGQSRHADFGVTHGGGGVAVNRTEIALPVDQQVPQGESLGHAHDGVVNRGVAVGVVLADDVTHDACRLFIRLVVVVAQLVHGVQHAPVHRLEAVTHIGQGAANDDAHRVVQVGPAHFVF